MHKFTKALAAIGLAAVMSQSAIAENLKLGFLVKQPEEPWFQTEWKFADKAGKDLGKVRISRSFLPKLTR